MTKEAQNEPPNCSRSDTKIANLRAGLYPRSLLGTAMAKVKMPPTGGMAGFYENSGAVVAHPALIMVQ